MHEHGAPKDTYDHHPGTEHKDDDDEDEDDDVAGLVCTPNHLSRPSRTTTVEAQQQQVPTVRRSSRIREKTQAVASETSNHTSNRQIEQPAMDPPKNENDVVCRSALLEHEKNEGHHIDWPNVRILWRDNISYRLLIKESLIIRAYEPRLNRTTHSVPLLIFPEGLERSLVPDPNG